MGGLNHLIDVGGFTVKTWIGLAGDLAWGSGASGRVHVKAS